MQQVSIAPDVILKVVLSGEDTDPQRRGSKTVVARSECRFSFDDDAALERCIEQLRLSDEHLRNRPQELMLWDWGATKLERLAYSDAPGGVVVLGVAWYDLDFFNAHKDAYTNPSHLAKYLEIGIKPGSVQVSHWKYEGGGAL